MNDWFVCFLSVSNQLLKYALNTFISCEWLIPVFSVPQLMRVMASNSRLEQKLDSCLWTQKVLLLMVAFLLALTVSLWTSWSSSDPAPTVQHRLNHAIIYTDFYKIMQLELTHSDFNIIYSILYKYECVNNKTDTFVMHHCAFLMQMTESALAWSVCTKTN